MPRQHGRATVRGSATPPVFMKGVDQTPLDKTNYLCVRIALPLDSVRQDSLRKNAPELLDSNGDFVYQAADTDVVVMLGLGSVALCLHESGCDTVYCANGRTFTQFDLPGDHSSLVANWVQHQSAMTQELTRLRCLGFVNFSDSILPILVDTLTNHHAAGLTNDSLWYLSNAGSGAWGPFDDSWIPRVNNHVNERCMN